jgi:hypothetical protein
MRFYLQGFRFRRRWGFRSAEWESERCEECDSLAAHKAWSGSRLFPAAAGSQSPWISQSLPHVPCNSTNVTHVQSAAYFDLHLNDFVIHDVLLWSMILLKHATERLYETFFPIAASSHFTAATRRTTPSYKTSPQVLRSFDWGIPALDTFTSRSALTTLGIPFAWQRPIRWR